jgi:hypothetical protein
MDLAEFGAVDDAIHIFENYPSITSFTAGDMAPHISICN